MSIEDKELDEMFHGEPKPLHPDTIYKVSGIASEAVSKKGTTTKEKDPHKPTHNFENGKWEPVKERNWMDNLKDCVKWAGCFGGLSLLLFYWELSGLMDESIAVPCMCLCTALAGFGVGKTARCK